MQEPINHPRWYVFQVKSFVCIKNTHNDNDVSSLWGNTEDGAFETQSSGSCSYRSSSGRKSSIQSKWVLDQRLAVFYKRHIAPNEKVPKCGHSSSPLSVPVVLRGAHATLRCVAASAADAGGGGRRLEQQQQVMNGQPRSERLLQPPAGVSREQRWTWNRFFLGCYRHTLCCGN